MQVVAAILNAQTPQWNDGREVFGLAGPVFGIVETLFGAPVQSVRSRGTHVRYERSPCSSRKNLCSAQRDLCSLARKRCSACGKPCSDRAITLFGATNTLFAARESLLRICINRCGRGRCRTTGARRGDDYRVRRWDRISADKVRLQWRMRIFERGYVKSGKRGACREGLVDGRDGWRARVA
jgi:hypothetical protein